jgi:protein-tyrosine phosphatase
MLSLIPGIPGMSPELPKRLRDDTSGGMAGSGPQCVEMMGLAWMVRGTGRWGVGPRPRPLAKDGELSENPFVRSDAAASGRSRGDPAGPVAVVALLVPVISSETGSLPRRVPMDVLELRGGVRDALLLVVVAAAAPVVSPAEESDDGWRRSGGEEYTAAFGAAASTVSRRMFASSGNMVHRYGIRAFICVAAEVMVPLPAFVQPSDIESGAVAFKHVKLQDGPSTLLAEHLQDVFGFIDEQISAGRPVAIYCQQGKSRSASLVAAYLMREYGIDSREALDLLHAVYPRADPNFFFLHQLDEIGVSLPPLPEHRRPSSDTDGGDDHAILSITSSSDPLHPLPPPPEFVTQRTTAMAEARAADEATKSATTLVPMTAVLAAVPDAHHLAPMSPDALQTTQPPRSEVPSPHQDDDSLSPLNAGFATVPSTPLVTPMTM